MPDYLLVHPLLSFEQTLRPALAEAWRRRTFRGAPLIPSWRTAAADYAGRFHIDPGEIFLTGFSPEVHFEPYLWRTLVGELLVVCAAEMPQLPSHLESLERLLAPAWQSSEKISPAHLPQPLQSLHGSRELTFGLATYRPGFASWNTADDNHRLRDLLRAIDPAGWSVEALRQEPFDADADDLLEELAFARQWFGVLVDLYERLVREDCVVIFETVHG